MTTPTIELKPSAHPLPAAEREAILANPGFGRHFTDHMVTIKWTEGRGWHDGQLVPYAPISLDPATTVLRPLLRSTMTSCGGRADGCAIAGSSEAATALARMPPVWRRPSRSRSRAPTTTTRGNGTMFIGRGSR